MYRRILVPVDGSEPSSLGLKHALGLARDQNARVRVLHVTDDAALMPMVEPYGVVDTRQFLDAIREGGERTLSVAAAAAAKAGVKAETALVENRGRPVSDVILEEAGRMRADLVVMGTHGRRGFNRLLLGSDAERVLREATVPVLLVRTPDKSPAARRKRASTRSRRR